MKISNAIKTVTEQLNKPDTNKYLTHEYINHVSLPSSELLNEMITLFKSVIFPGYFGTSDINNNTLKYHTGATLDRAASILRDQIKRGYCFVCSTNTSSPVCVDCERRAEEQTLLFISKLPQIKKMLATDVHAAYLGDPAAKNRGEAIFCYPSITALTNHRIAHELYLMDVPLIPRIISELAHSSTGIDIHPGARIGEYFFMDHGTGIVIGETCIIGNHVRLYQGVTLGAKSFASDEDGNPVKGIDRHPIIADNVIIYAGATVLGRINIGKSAIIGGNVWITNDVQAGAKILQGKTRITGFENGAGI